MKPISTFLLVVCLITTVLVAVTALSRGVPFDQVLFWSGVALSFLWAWVLLTLPWDLHFKAREVLASMRAMWRDLQVAHATNPDAPSSSGPSNEDFAYATTVQTRTLILSIALHVVSATIALVIAMATGSWIGYCFAGFFLLGCLVRPSIAVFQQIRRRLEGLASRALYPQDSVLTLLKQLRDQSMSIASLERQARDSVDKDTKLAEDIVRNYESLNKAMSTLRQQQTDLGTKVQEGLLKFERQLMEGDSGKELLTGIRALLAMIRATPL